MTCERARRENCEQNIARLQAINCSERATGLLNTIQSVSQAVQTLLTETSIERIESKQNLRVPRAISTDFRTSGLSLSSSR